MDSIGIVVAALSRAILASAPASDSPAVADLRANLWEEMAECPACHHDDVYAIPAEALEAWLRGESTKPWWPGTEPAWVGHLDPAWRQGQ